MGKPPSAISSRAPWWRRHAVALREAGLGSVTVACALTAIGLGGDMTLTGLVCFVGWAVGSTGLATAPNQTLRWKFATICALMIASVGECGFLYWHFKSPKNQSSIGGALISFSIPDPEKLANGLNGLPIRVTNAGDTPLLNYTYHFAQSITDHPLTVGEELTTFEKLVAAKFYPLIKSASKKRRLPPDIFNSLQPGSAFQLLEPNVGYTDDQIQQMINQSLLVYDFLIVRYTDKASMHQTYYYGEFCAQRLFKGGITPCPFHNFVKHAED